MNSRSKESQLFMVLLAILMLTTSLALHVHRVPHASPDISDGQPQGHVLQNRFISSYTTHDPITITSNADFASQSFSGSGTAEDPYVIEGYNITTTGTCISVQDTDAYFVIRGCLLTGYSPGRGIELDSVSYGTIRNNTISGSNDGVYIDFSSDNSLVNNTISGNSRFGVHFHSSSNNIVVNNTISGNDYGGVNLFYSSNNTFSSNIFMNNGIRIYGNKLEHCQHTITPDNLVNEKPLGYFWSWTGGTIDGTQYGQVLLANCTGVTVENGEFSNATVGIELAYSSYCRLMNNTISRNFFGMYLKSSSDNTMVNNTIWANTRGVYIEHSSNNIVVDNTISENDYGVDIPYSYGNTVVNNTISGNTKYGVYLTYTSDNTLSSNIFVNDGIYISGDEVEYWQQNITPDNLVNGKSLGYFWNLTGGTIDGTQYGQVILANCTGMIVEDGVFSSTTVGILLGYSSYCSLANSTLSGNHYGVDLSSSSYNIVANNTISENNQGVSLSSSYGNTIVSNIISANSYRGVSLSSSAENNIIYLNVFADNRYVTAYDDGVGNHWNSTVTGNYWSDYSGTGVYNVLGSAGSIDYYPFIYDMSPPTISQPGNIDYEEGTSGHTITWNPSDDNPSNYVVYRNSTEVASANWDGSSITVEVDGLSVGVYNYTIRVYDTSGNWVSDTVLVTVLHETTTTTTTTTTNEELSGLSIVLLGVFGIEVVVAVIILVRRYSSSTTESETDYMDGSHYY